MSKSLAVIITAKSEKNFSQERSLATEMCLGSLIRKRGGVKTKVLLKDKKDFLQVCQLLQLELDLFLII